MYLNVEDILSIVSHGSRLLKRLSQKPQDDTQALDFRTSSGDTEKMSGTLEPKQKETQHFEEKVMGSESCFRYGCPHPLPCPSVHFRKQPDSSASNPYPIALTAEEP